MRVSAKVDYALRAMAELAAAPPGLTTAEQLASAQQIPPKFLESILSQLRSAGLISSQRGAGRARRGRGRAPGRGACGRTGSPRRPQRPSAAGLGSSPRLTARWQG